MLAKCANPDCGAPFRYLRDGRIFRVERAAERGESPGHNVEHFWLCGACSAFLTLHTDRDGNVSVVPQRPGKPHEAA